MSRLPYDTDLSDGQWQVIGPLIPPAKPGGRARVVDIREVLNAIFYLLRTGCTWRLLPHEFPAHKTVYHYFRVYRDDGTWQMIHDTLREQVRVAAGREATPSAGCLDSQSVKTTEKGALAAMMRGRRSTDANGTWW